MSVDISAFAHLTRAEKFAIVQALWQDIAASPDEVPIPQWHIDELELREREFAKNPEPEMSWEDAKAWIRNRDGRKT